MDNFIEVYKNVFDKQWCQDVMQRLDDAESLGMTKSRQELDKASELQKKDIALFIPSFPLAHTDRKTFNTFNEVFWKECYQPYANKYSILKQCQTHNIFTLKAQKTRPGEGYHIWHCEKDNKESSDRLLTWTVYLNDDFEAGETEFIYQQYRYKPSQGDCVIFPAGFTHTHRGNPPIGNTKYIVTGWVEFGN